jgi:6-phosphogluconolactonase
MQTLKKSVLVLGLFAAFPFSCSAPVNGDSDAGFPDGSTGGGAGGSATGGGGGAGGSGGGDADSGTGAGTDAGLPDSGGTDAGAFRTPYVYVVSNQNQVRVYALDAGSGGFTFKSSVSSAGAGFLAFSTDKRTAYVTKNNTVEALAMNPSSGALTSLNQAASGGAGAVHVFTESTGKYVLVANYAGGNASVLPIIDGGRLGTATDTVNAGVEAHQIVADPSNRYVFVPCKGDNWVAQYLFDADAGTLTPNAVPHVSTAAGAGPRHLAFHPGGGFAYLINEVDDTITALSLDGSTGQLTPFQTLSTIPMAMANTTAEVEVHPSGKFVYGSNRGHNSIVGFSLDAGYMTLIGHASTGGMTPRHFSIDPTGTLLFAANQGSSDVHSFRINPSTGALTPLGEAAQPNAPSFVGAIYLP